MFSFAVFDASGLPRASFELRGEHLIANTDLPTPGRIRFESGLIRCEKDDPEAAGLALQVEVPAPDRVTGGTGIANLPTPSQGLGVLALRTCFLPRREEPYLLSLELARHRIMLILNKLEEWGLFELAPDHPVMQQVETARVKFSEALVADRISGVGANAGAPSPRAWADRLAWSSLAIAIDASEKLSLLIAERTLPLRQSGVLFDQAVARYTKLVGDPPSSPGVVVVPGSGGATVGGVAQIGVVAHPATFAEPLHKVAASLDFVHVPTRWSDLEPAEGKLSFTGTDRWIEWGIRTAKLPVSAGPIIDLRAACLPEWAYIWENDYETLRDMMIEHIKQVVTRYRRTVNRWVVCSGLHVNSNVKLTYEQIMDLTKVCVLLTRKLHPAAKVLIEVQEPWGEYFAADRNSLPPTFYAESVLNSGLSIDGLALRLQMGGRASGQSTRDLMAISTLIDRYAAMDRALHVTALGAPASPPAGPAPRPSDDEDDLSPQSERAMSPGFWRAAWSESLQAEWLSCVLAVVASKPSVQSIAWQMLADDPPGPRVSEMHAGGLVTLNGASRAAAARLAQFKSAWRDARARPV